MATSVFSLSLSLENYLQEMMPGIKKLIYLLGEVSLGVYLIHVLVMQFIGTLAISGFEITSDQGGKSICLRER